MKLFRALRGDPLLLALTVVLTLAAWVPLTVTPILPFADLHNNTAEASLLVDAALGRGTIGYHYHVNWAPVPYWTAFVIIAVASALGGVLFAAKAIVAVLVVVVPLSVMRLLLALGRSPRLGLWAFALVWEHNLYSGWITYLLGMAIALVALALLIEMETLRDALGVLAWTALVSLTHIQAVALLALAGAGITAVAVRRGKRVALHAVALGGGAIPVLPWVGQRLAPGGHAPKVPWTFDWHPMAIKVGRIFTYSLENQPKEPEVWAPAFAFAVALVGPLVLASAVRQRGVGVAPGGPIVRDGGLLAAIVAMSCVALYAALPFEIRGPVSHWHNYPRYVSFVLLTLLLLPRPDLRRWRALWLLPGVLAALAMDVTVTDQLRRFGQNCRPFLKLFPLVREGSRLLTLINVEGDPNCVINPYNQFHSYLSASTKSFDPYMFHHDSHPLLYTAAHDPPIPRWQYVTDQLVMEKHARYFDYILVQGLDRDPFRPFVGRLSRARVHLLGEGGIWRLYEIDKERDTAEPAP
jgi:hypothetical protein